MLTEIIVEPNQEILLEYRKLLETAYQNGADRGSHIEISDLMLAVDKAAEAFGPKAAEFLELADFGEVDDDVKIHFTEGTEVTDEAWSARLLLKAFRHNDGFDWEDVDAAYEALTLPSTAPTM